MKKGATPLRKAGKPFAKGPPLVKLPNMVYYTHPSTEHYSLASDTEHTDIDSDGYTSEWFSSHLTRNPVPSILELETTGDLVDNVHLDHPDEEDAEATSSLFRPIL